MSDSFYYEGDISLLYSEGGFGSADIELEEMETDGWNWSLDQVLNEKFGTSKCFDQNLGKLRILIERSE